MKKTLSTILTAAIIVSSFPVSNTVKVDDFYNNDYTSIYELGAKL